MSSVVKNSIVFYYAVSENVESPDKISYGSKTLLKDIMQLLLKYYPNKSYLRSVYEFKKHLIRGSLKYRIDTEQPSCFAIYFDTCKIFEVELLETLKNFCALHKNYVVDLKVSIPPIKHETKLEVSYKHFHEIVVYKPIYD